LASEVCFLPIMRLVGEDVLKVAFATRISRGIALRLLAKVTTTSSSNSEPNSIAGEVVRRGLKGRGGRLKQREALVEEPYIYYISEFAPILN